MNLMDLELELELKALRSEIDKLKKESAKYKKLIVEHGLEDELDDFVATISPEEQICLDGIGHLAELFKNGTYDSNDTKNFDLLHKNLRLIRGHVDNTKKKGGKFDKDAALAIVEGFKK